MNQDFRALRDVFGRFATGVCIVTCAGWQRQPCGVTVNSFSSVSLDPPLILFSLDRRRGSYEQFVNARHFAVNVLHESQVELSRTFATSGADKWRGLAYETWETGAPILPDSLACMECDRIGEHQGGDHVIVLGQVRRTRCAAAGEPLLFFRGEYRAIGDRHVSPRRAG
jgi:flavin reductase (DIM6/NTAB) family NADH-FMN oxidoreductase RutF